MAKAILKVINSGSLVEALGVGCSRPLAELRERWETKFGGAWDWIEPEVKEWQPPASPLDLPAKLIK